MPQAAVANITSDREYEAYELDPRYAYLEFLFNEARALRAELWPDGNPDREWMAYTAARGKRISPSSRAEEMLKAAGISFPEHVQRQRAVP